MMNIILNLCKIHYEKSSGNIFFADQITKAVLEELFKSLLGNKITIYESSRAGAKKTKKIDRGVILQDHVAASSYQIKAGRN